jgi:CRP/FNR family transcriptional regulator, cyclic AMP receptor protein
MRNAIKTADLGGVSCSGPQRPAAFSPPAIKLAVLRRYPLFRTLPLEHIERLSAYASTRAYARGATIFTKGDPGTSLFAVCSGTIRIAVPSPDGRDAVFNLIREGEIFGEIALLDGKPRTADATAMTDSELMLIDRRDFVGVLESQPETALKLIEVLCARVRKTSQQVEDVLFLDLPGRLAKQLLRLIGDAERSRGDHKVLMTQRELGQMIGMSRESTNKQLREWEERNWVRIERGEITVLVPEALSAIGTPAIDL